MDYKFYDTSSLLNGYKYQFFNKQDKKVISSTTLKQLEDMKPSETAKFVLSYIYQHPEEFEIYFFKEPMMDKIYEMGLPRDTEMEILAAAIDYETRYHPDEMILITDNLYLYNVANLFFGDGVIQTHYN